MYRILIVEDDAGIAEAVSEQAKMWNFETHSVTNFRNVWQNLWNLIRILY